VAIIILVAFAGLLAFSFAAFVQVDWRAPIRRWRYERAHREWEASMPVPPEQFTNGGYHAWLSTEEAAAWLAKEPQTREKRRRG
jgi:hypothetical protein